MNPLEMNQIYQESVGYILPNILLQGKEEEKPPDKEALKKGIKGLESLNSEYEKSGKSSWACLWFIGKAYQALGQHQEAYQNFLLAHKQFDHTDSLDPDINQGHADIMRELALSCLHIKEFKNAVYYCNLAMQFALDDYSLWANYAVSLLLNGDIDSAEDWAKRTLEKWDDESTKTLLKMIQEIKKGKRKLPNDVSEL